MSRKLHEEALMGARAIELPSELQMPDRQIDWPETMPVGIYFGLDEDDYHADPSLSNSGIKQMLVHPLEYWAHSWMNPLRPDDEDTKFLILGRAYDKRVIEGKAAFDAKFVRRLERADHPDALVTVDDIKARLRELGQPLKGNKDELIDRLLAVEPDAPVWDEIASRYGLAHAGKTFLPGEEMVRIEYRAAMIERHPELKKAFSGGYPQVSIFWRDPDTGVPMKARADYLKVKALIDLKTFGNPLGKPIDRAIANAVASNGYHRQACLYLEAADHAARFVREGRVFGDVDRDWCRRFAAADERTFAFVFQCSGAAPIAKGKVFTRGLVYDVAKVQIRGAILEYAAHWQRFGSDPWIDAAPMETFDDSEFPAWINEA